MPVALRPGRPQDQVTDHPVVPDGQRITLGGHGYARIMAGSTRAVNGSSQPWMAEQCSSPADPWGWNEGEPRPPDHRLTSPPRPFPWTFSGLPSVPTHPINPPPNPAQPRK